MKNSLKESIITSLITYIVFFLIFISLYNIWILEKYAVYLSMWLLFFLIKDILLFFVDIKKITLIKTDINRVKKDFSSWSLSFWAYSLFFNRLYFFPTILVIYMLFILVNQLGLLEWKESVYELIHTNILWITIVSWVLTTFKEDIDKDYQKTIKSSKTIDNNILLNYALSLVWAYIILLQTNWLWALSYIIGIVSGLLIFLVWISILEDDESEKEII